MTPQDAKRALSYKKFIALDTESTGFQPNNTYGKLLEVGAVKVVDGKVVDRFDRLINPGMKIPKKIQELTTITDEMVADKDNYVKVLRDFREWCDTDNFIFIMHNAPHDVAFLNFFGKKAGINFNDPYIDTQSLARNVLNKGGLWSKVNSRVNENYKLKTLAIYFNIGDEHHHRADNDAEVTWKVFEKLRQVILKYQPYVLSEQDWTYPPKENQNIENKTVRIDSICPWNKMKRVYINLSQQLEDEEKFSTIFYDFDFNCWKIKQKEFPITSFENVEKKVKELYKIDELKYEAFKESVHPKNCYVVMT